MHFLIVSPLSRCPSEVILSTHTVVSGYSSSLAISSQEQPLPRSVGGHLRTDGGKRETQREGRIFTTRTTARLSCIPMSAPLWPGAGKTE